MKKEQWNLAAPSDSLMTAAPRIVAVRHVPPVVLAKTGNLSPSQSLVPAPVCRQHTGQRNVLNCTRKNAGKSRLWELVQVTDLEFFYRKSKRKRRKRQEIHRIK